MTAAVPVRDSALDALGYAFGVLRKPDFLWAPIFLAALTTLPLLALPGMDGQTPVFNTGAEAQAYLEGMLPSFAAVMALGLLLGPISSAVVYQLGTQFLDGEDPKPFAPGIARIIWRFFLQTIVVLFATFVVLIGLGIFFVASTRIFGVPIATLFVLVLGLFLTFILVARTALAAPLIVAGHGPIESLRRSWQLTRGRLRQVLRWVIATGLIIGLVVLVINLAVTALFDAVRLPLLGQLISSILIAPFIVVQTIVLLRLTRLLSAPPGEPPPPPVMPDWMRPPA